MFTHKCLQKNFYLFKLYILCYVCVYEIKDTCVCMKLKIPLADLDKQKYIHILMILLIFSNT